MSFDTQQPSAAQASESGHTFEPTYPGSNTGIGATITVRGPRSPAVREHARRQFAQAQAKDLAARKNGKLADPPELDELDAALTDMAVVYTLGWAGMEQGGADLPYSEDAARALYTAHPWLREQVISEAQDLGKFIRPLPKTSSSTPGPSSTST